MHAILDLLLDPLVHSLLHTHPNDLLTNAPPSSSWAADPISDAQWIHLLHYHNANHKLIFHHIPSDLRALINNIRTLQLPRLPMNIHGHQVPFPTIGMSLKKAHEVSRMTPYIAHLLASLHLDPHSVPIVDIGAGKGYLTRALHSHLGAHILALDADHAQTRGAKSWEAKHAHRNSKRGLPRGRGSITHKTIHITPATLLDAINEWIAGDNEATHTLASGSGAAPTNVLLVALHACGSLTPDILRAFLASHATDMAHGTRTWQILGVVAVGCCYNLMRPTDFPLSRELAERFSSTPLLPPSAFHLASQVPSHWDTHHAALAVRKVAWRAMVGGELSGRLGRLPDAAYADWPVFLATVRASSASRDEGREMHGEAEGCQGFDLGKEEDRKTMESRLAVLHVLRCLLGPVVESLIILDRVQWLRERLSEGVEGEMDVEIVNLFDQAAGSGRNVAVVVAPRGALR